MEVSNRLNYNKFLIIIILLFSAVFLFFISHGYVLAPETAQVEIKPLRLNGSNLSVKEGEVFKAEIADTDKKRIRGLSGRESLPENQGMLFVFDTPNYYTFWMKEMNFSLDFIWIRGNKVIEITKNVKSEDYQPPKILVPKNKIDRVLEVNAGFAEKAGIKEGDMLEF